MIPYFDQPAWHVGPLTIHAFGATVALAAWLGLTLVQKRFVALGLDPAFGQRLGGWMLVGGLIGAHVFSVLFYFPQELLRDPLLILRVWEDISSFGGIVGALVAALLFFRLRARDQSSQTKLAYLDAIAFIFPPALAIGRFGCALAHDHPGTLTTFPLAISLRTDAAINYMTGVYREAGLAFPPNARAMGFHDLGLYEFLFLAIVVIPAFIGWNRRARPAGFFLVSFAWLYLPVRFALDMLRVADVRYIGLTPAQWVSASVMAALPFVVMRHRKLRFAITGAVILAAGWACAGAGR